MVTAPYAIGLACPALKSVPLTGPHVHRHEQHEETRV